MEKSQDFVLTLKILVEIGEKVEKESVVEKVEIFQDSRTDFQVYVNDSPVGSFLEGDPELDKYREKECYQDGK